MTHYPFFCVDMADAPHEPAVISRASYTGARDFRGLPDDFPTIHRPSSAPGASLLLCHPAPGEIRGPRKRRQNLPRSLSHSGKGQRPGHDGSAHAAPSGARENRVDAAQHSRALMAFSALNVGTR